MRIEKFENKCYEAYKIHWMLTHGKSLEEYSKGCEEDGCFEGFDDGSCFVCKDEFLGAEFKDKYYMYNLFALMPDRKRLNEIYDENYLAD